MSEPIKSKRGLTLSVKEAEIFCSADFSERPESLAEQRYFALKIAQIYETGLKDLNKNHWKAKKYLAEATNTTPVTRGFWSAETSVNFLGLFTTIRLSISRMNGLLKHPYIGKAFLNRFFSIAGFSYFLDLGIDLYQVITHAYSAMPDETAEEKHRPLYKRFANRTSVFFRCFSNMLFEDDRIYRMLNAAVWGSLNLFFFCFAPPLAVAINIAGFVFDVANKYFQTNKEVGIHLSLLNKLNHIVHHLEDKRLQLTKDLTNLKRQKHLKQIEYRLGNSPENELSELDEKIRHKKHQLELVENDLQRRHFEKDKIEIKVDEAKEKRFTGMTLVSILLVGVVLATVPGLNIGLAALGSAILVGATFYTLSKKIWDLGKKINCWYKRRTQHAHAKDQHKPELISHHSTPDNELKSTDSNTPLSQAIQNDIHFNNEMNTATVQAKLTKKINFLSSCEQKVAAAANVGEAFEMFSNKDIKRLKNIFGFKKDEEWQKQLKYWIRYTHNPNAKSSNTNRFFDRCSFKESLRLRIHEEQQYKRMLEEDQSNKQLREAEFSFVHDSKEDEAKQEFTIGRRIGAIQ